MDHRKRPPDLCGDRGYKFVVAGCELQPDGDVMAASADSWIVIDLATGAAVMEFWNPDLLARLNTRKYRAVTAYDYLCGLNEYPSPGRLGGRP